MRESLIVAVVRAVACLVSCLVAGTAAYAAGPPQDVRVVEALYRDVSTILLSYKPSGLFRPCVE